MRKGVNKALKHLLTGAVEEKALCHLKHTHIGHVRASIRQYFEDFHTNYRNTSCLDRQQNKERMKYLWTQEHPIQKVFQQLEEATEYAQHSNSSFSNN